MLTAAFEINHALAKHLPTMLQIERASFVYPQSRKDFEYDMRRRDGGAYVALLPDGTVIGYITFAFSSKAFRIVNLAVHPDYRRLGVGAKLVDKLKAKLNRPEIPTRFTISLYITTENLVGLSFFKSQKFRAISEIVGRYPNAPEKAAYLLIYRDLPSVKLDPAYAAHRPTS